MTFAHDQDMVSTLPTHTAQEALADGIGARGTDRSTQDLDTARCRDASQLRTVLNAWLGGRCCGRGRPDKSKTVSVPAQQCLRLDEHERLCPGGNTGREEDQEETIESAEGRTVALSLEHDALLAQECVFGNQLCPPSD